MRLKVIKHDVCNLSDTEIKAFSLVLMLHRYKNRTMYDWTKERCCNISGLSRFLVSKYTKIAFKNGWVRETKGNLTAVSHKKKMGNRHKFEAESYEDIYDNLKSIIILNNISRQKYLIELRKKGFAQYKNKESLQELYDLGYSKESVINKYFIASRKLGKLFKQSNTTALKVFKRMIDKGIIKAERWVMKFTLPVFVEPYILEIFKPKIKGYRYSYSNKIVIDCGYFLF